MENGYTLYKKLGIVTVRYTFLLKSLNKSLQEIISEITDFAETFEAEVENDDKRNRIIIYGKDIVQSLEILLFYLEIQLLIQTDDRNV